MLWYIWRDEGRCVLWKRSELPSLPPLTSLLVKHSWEEGNTVLPSFLPSLPFSPAFASLKAPIRQELALVLSASMEVFQPYLFLAWSASSEDLSLFLLLTSQPLLAKTIILRVHCRVRLGTWVEFFTTISTLLSRSQRHTSLSTIYAPHCLLTPSMLEAYSPNHPSSAHGLHTLVRVFHMLACVDRVPLAFPPPPLWLAKYGGLRRFQWERGRLRLAPVLHAPLSTAPIRSVWCCFVGFFFLCFYGLAVINILVEQIFLVLYVMVMKLVLGFFGLR